MTLPVFYAADLDGDTVVLAGEEGHHAADVRRLRVGERLRVTDGAGRLAEASVVEAGRGRLSCAVHDRWTEPAPDPRITVALAVVKGERMGRAVEALTEAGADAILPWIAERTVALRDGAAGGRALARWQAAAREAAKQARRARFPQLDRPADLAGVAERASRAALTAVCHEAAGAPIGGLPVPGSGELLVVIGPEGGLTEAELATLEGAGGRPVRLGGSVLRSGTAALAALAVISAASGRWGPRR